MKRKLTILLVVSLILNFGFVKAEVSQTTISYLTNQSQNQWITMGLAANNQNNLDLSYLDDFEANSANDYSKTILALTAVSENPYNYDGTDFVAGLENYYTNNQFGSTELLSDDFWAIMALRSAGYAENNQMIQASKTFILSNQNEDGGFSYAPGADSDSNDTAAAILALLDTGLSANSQAVQDALDYLQSIQNDDGGFPFVTGSESDSGSDSWVIIALNKAGISPNSWSVEGNTSLAHLQTLALEDGSYRWLVGDQSGSPLMTAYASVALSGNYYPINYYEEPVETGTYHLRIEGSQETLCDALVEATTALDIIENGAVICGYDYIVDQYGDMFYVSSIAGEAGAGMAGWLYRVNYEDTNQAANAFELQEGDEVLYVYGEWGIQPLRLSLSANQIEPGESITVNAEYFNETAWLPAEDALVYIGESFELTNNLGQVTMQMDNVGAYEVYVEQDGFIRSERLNLLVADEAIAQVNMIVNIDPNGGIPDGSISFTVATDELDFGTIGPGQNQVTEVRIINNGNSSMYLETIISGDELFEDNTFVDEELWEDYQDVFSGNEARDVAVRLSIPANFAGSGIRQGSLTFWASSQ